MVDDGQAMYEKVRAIKRTHEAELLARSNVVGVGVGLRQQGGDYTGQVALIVMVRQKVPIEELAPKDVIPDEIDGVAVDVQEVGEISAHG